MNAIPPTGENRPATSGLALEAEMRRLADALALAERDRQLWGYEIHDGVVQDLTAALMLLEGAGRQATFGSPEAEDNFAGGLRLLQESIAEARRLVRGATTAEPPTGGLIAALSRLVERFRADPRLPVRFECKVQELPLPASVEHLLLRIAQESLYNVWKHAQATEVEVRLNQNEDQLELSIADNGVGFDPAAVPAGHYGLESIRARVRLLDANLLFDTAPHHGTRVVVQLAIPPKPRPSVAV
jgi:signal transduction histidine kinase